MLRSEGLNCEMPVNNSFPQYADFRRNVFSTSSSDYYQTNGASYSGVNGNFKNFECGFQATDVGSSSAENDVVYEQLNGEVGAGTVGATNRNSDTDDAHRNGYLSSCRKTSTASGNADQEDSLVYPACRKFPAQYSPGLQGFGAGTDFTKHPGYGSGGLYQASFPRQSPSYPMFPDSLNVGQVYYHGQMSPAIGHSPPGLMSMGCMQPGAGTGFYPHGSICVYLCNRELWSKFYQHTCEMIITKQGR